VRSFLILSVIVCTFMATACANKDWRNASRESAGIAADPTINKDATIEFYAADAFSWRGWFAVHSWLAIKEQDAKEYTVYEVVGWRVNSGLPALRSFKTETPDKYWYGAKPERFLSISGEKATHLITKMKLAIERYPWVNEYSLLPGPNSNTFPAWVGLQVPELELDMPFRAIGSGYAEE
jgi:hypothetical protein